MIINIASKNPAKVKAVEEVFSEYSIFDGFELNSVDSNSEVPKQPFDLKDIREGSRNRAKNCFENCDYSVGLESGLIEVIPGEKIFYDICFASIYNGKKLYSAPSAAVEIPRYLINSIINCGMDLGEACQKHGLSEDRHIGSREGIVGKVTSERVDRKEQTKQALYMAMAKLENPHFYKDDFKNIGNTHFHD